MGHFIPDTFSGPFLIIGEGVQDQIFALKLVQHYGILGFEAGHAGGKDGFGDVLGGLKVHRSFQNLKTVVIFADTDEDPTKAFANIKTQITNAGGYDIPNQPLEIVGSHPSIVVVMLPWEDRKGCLETLCLEPGLNQYPNIKACLTPFSDCLNMSAWDTSRRSKALLQCLFATACASDPNTGLRYAWDRVETLIPLNHTSFDGITSFLRELSTSSEAI